MEAILEMDEEVAAAGVCPTCEREMRLVSEEARPSLEHISEDCHVHEVRAIVRYVCDECGLRRSLVV